LPEWIGHWLRDTRLLLASQTVVVLVTIALAIILARGLGPSDWGLFSALLGLSLALSTFVDLGLGTWLLRGLSRLHEDEPELEDRRRESSRRILGAALANITFGVVLVIGASVVVAVLQAQIATAVALVGLIAYTVFLTASNCLEAFLRSERKVKLVVTATLLEKCLLLALVSIGVLLSASIWLIALAYLLAGLVRVSFVGFVIFVKQHLPVVVPGYRHVRRFVLSGVPFAFNTVALNVIPRLDPFIVALVSVTAAGYFAVGDRIVTAALIVPAVAGTALYPFLARETAGSRVAWKISAGMMLVGFAAALAGVILAPFAIPVVFGSDYEAAVPVVQVMLFVIPFVYASNPLLVHLYTSGKERKVLGATLLASLVGTTAILVGQVSFGASGAAAGCVVRQALFTVTLSGIALAHTRTAADVEALDSPQAG
jgi:O-antigen/teichoic acid export membrane protein